MGVGAGTDSQITANHTNLIGGMIANASWEIPEGADENAAPVLVDHGQLNFTTDTLTVEDLRDYSRSSQSGGGIQTGFGLGVYDGTDEQLKERGTTHLKGEEYVTGSTTISLQSEGHRMEGQTLATIGDGNILVGGIVLDEHEGFADLNRDVEHAQIVMLEQQTGALNGSVSVDHRLFSEAGRQVITDQHVDLKDNFKATAGGLVGDVARVGAVAASVGQITQLGNSLGLIDGAQETAYREDGELAAQTEAFRDGKIEDAVAAQELLNELDGVLNDGSGGRVLVTDGAFNPDGNLVAGAANVDTNALYADMGENARGSIINTLAHEGMHLEGAGDWMAAVTGYLADFTYRVNAWANSSAINSHGPIYIPVQNASAHQALLSQNIGMFANDAARGHLEYRQLNRHEMGAVLSPDNQLRYQMMRQAMGLAPSDNPGRDLYIAAIAAVDEQAAGIVRPDYTATLAIDALRGQSVAAGVGYQNDSGSVNALFEASIADYAAPLVNSTSLYNEEQFNAFLVKDFLLPGFNEYGQHDLYSNNYLPAMAEGNRIAGDALRDQTLMILGGSLAAPAVISGATTTYGLVTTQGQFWAGTASHIGLRGAQSVGAAGQVNLWSASSTLGQGMGRLSFSSAELLYGSGSAAAEFVMYTGGVGFIVGAAGGIPGTPPAYVPDGLPPHPAFGALNTGMAVGQSARQAYFFLVPEQRQEHP